MLLEKRCANLPFMYIYLTNYHFFLQYVVCVEKRYYDALED